MPVIKCLIFNKDISFFNFDNTLTFVHFDRSLRAISSFKFEYNTDNIIGYFYKYQSEHLFIAEEGQLIQLKLELSSDALCDLKEASLASIEETPSLLTELKFMKHISLNAQFIRTRFLKESFSFITYSDKYRLSNYLRQINADDILAYKK